MDFKLWLEARELEMGTYPDEIDPIKEDDEFRVYHGFYSYSDAINIALHGTSGGLRAKRVYSYESENNPRGLFVTLDRKTAQKGFAGGSQPTVMQFVAKESELRPPVWPGSGYTVQGQMAQYFYQHPKGERIGRAEAQKKAKEDAMKSRYDAISKSNRPELAQMLFGSEMQALFVGHLDPDRIEGFWVQRQQDPDYRKITDPWEFLTREQFIEEFGKDFDYKGVADDDTRLRMFTPDEDFSWERVAQYINDEYNKYDIKSELDTYDQVIGALMGRDFKKDMRRDYFEAKFKQYFWPKQLPQLYNWIKKMYRQYGEPDTRRGE